MSLKTTAGCHAATLVLTCEATRFLQQGGKEKRKKKEKKERKRKKKPKCRSLLYPFVKIKAG